MVNTRGATHPHSNKVLKISIKDIYFYFLKISKISFIREGDFQFLTVIKNEKGREREKKYKRVTTLIQFLHTKVAKLYIFLHIITLRSTECQALMVPC